jgi:hypothetical protein
VPLSTFVSPARARALTELLVRLHVEARRVQRARLVAVRVLLSRPRAMLRIVIEQAG